MVYRENHGTEKWRLRTSEVIGAVGVEDRTVVFDFEEEILYHTPSEIELSVFDKSAHDEVTVPSIHFIEPAARDNVRIGQVEQARLRQALGKNLAQVGYGARQRFNVHSALLCELGDRWGNLHVIGKIKHTAGVEKFGIR